MWCAGFVLIKATILKQDYLLDKVTVDGGAVES